MGTTRDDDDPGTPRKRPEANLMKRVTDLSAPARMALLLLARVYPDGIDKDTLIGQVEPVAHDAGHARGAVTMLLQSDRAEPGPGPGQVRIAPTLVLDALTHLGADPVTPVERCLCGMPVELGGDACPDCAAKGAQRRPAWRRKGARSRPWDVKHRAPTAPPLPRGRRPGAVCPDPLKTGYRSERDALLFLVSEAILNQWPYLCRCGQWHNATMHGGVLRRWQVSMLSALADDRDAPITRDAYTAPVLGYRPGRR